MTVGCVLILGVAFYISLKITMNIFITHYVILMKHSGFEF